MWARSEDGYPIGTTHSKQFKCFEDLGALGQGPKGLGQGPLGVMKGREGQREGGKEREAERVFSSPAHVHLLLHRFIPFFSSHGPQRPLPRTIGAVAQEPKGPSPGK